MNRLLIAVLTFTFASGATYAATPEIVDHNQMMDHGEGHLMDMDGGMVMGQNKDTLPGGCTKISEDARITVHGGHKYSKKFPGTMFAFDQQEFRFKPCTRLTVTFVNEDNVRHQWMMHGLPKYIYDKGMFHLEVTGPAKVSGTLILPNEDKTYLVHCDIAQHMEKGMKAQLVVGKGSGTFPSIPGLTDPAIPDDYGGLPTGMSKSASTVVATGKDAALGAPQQSNTAPAGTNGAPAVADDSNDSVWSSSMLIGVLAGMFGTPLIGRWGSKRFAGMGAAEIVSALIDMLGGFGKKLWDLLNFIYQILFRIKGYLPKK